MICSFLLSLEIARTLWSDETNIFHRVGGQLLSKFHSRFMVVIFKHALTFCGYSLAVTITDPRGFVCCYK